MAAAPPQPPEEQPRIVLVRPQMGENIGAAARAMANFGLARMRLVAPRDGWPNPAAQAMASGAGRLLDAASLEDDLPGALADCHYVLATTARTRGLTKPVFSPEAAMRETARRIARGEVRAGARALSVLACRWTRSFRASTSRNACC